MRTAYTDRPSYRKTEPKRFRSLATTASIQLGQVRLRPPHKGKVLTPNVPKGGLDPRDHGDAIECPYTWAWRFDPDEYEVLIGHYVHAYNPKIVHGRGVIFDEFTDAL